MRKDPRLLLALGAVFVLLAFAWPRFIHPSFLTLSPDATDGVQGFLIGVWIGLNGLAVWMLSRARRDAGAEQLQD